MKIHHHPLGSGLTPSTDPVSLYLNSLAVSGRRAMRCMLHAVTDIVGFDGRLEDMPWPLVGCQHLALVKNTLRQQGKSANTINLALSAVRGVMKACFHLQLITSDQLMRLKGVTPLRSQRLPSGRSLSKQEVIRLHRHCREDTTVIGKRDHAIIALMLSTGLRRSEVIAIQLDNYHTRTGLLIVQAGKGNQQRRAYLATDSRQRVAQWLKARGNQPGNLFNPVSKSGLVAIKALTGQTIYDIITRRSALARIGLLRPHDLRRTFVTQLLAAGVDINTTRQLVGHADIQTTARYDCRDVKAQQKALRRVMSGGKSSR